MKTAARKPVPMLASILVLIPVLMRAEIAVEAWVQRYNGPGNSDDHAAGMAVDGSNNVIVTGYCRDNESFADYLTIKYSGAGVPLWTNRYNGTGNYFDTPYAVMVDHNNDVIVTGYSTGSGSGDDYLTIKYSSAGVPLWTNRYNGPGNDQDGATAVAIGDSNDVIVTGYSTGSSSNWDYLTIKYSSMGVPLWTNRYNGPLNDRDIATAVTVDGSNNVILTGRSIASYNDYTTIKYSSAGELLWIARYNWIGGSDDSPNALAVDGSNNVIVTGDSAAVGGTTDYLTIKYSSAGMPLWTNRYNGSYSPSEDSAKALAVDSSHDVIVTGWAQENVYGYDYATIKYSSAGVPLWTNRYSGPGNSADYAMAVAVDSSDNVVVTGHCVRGNSHLDYLTIKYSSAGVPLWTNYYDGPGGFFDLASAVAVDSGNNIIMTGSSVGSGSGFDFTTIKYSFPPVIADPRMTNGTFQMCVENVSQPGTVVIEASTGLADWSPVSTNTTTTNVLFYTDPDAGSYFRRFYRALQLP